SDGSVEWAKGMCSKSPAFENAPSAPGAGNLHWRTKVANQNCCSHRRNKQVVAVRTHDSGFPRVGKRLSGRGDSRRIFLLPLPGAASGCHFRADAFGTAPIQLVRKIWRPTA